LLDEINQNILQNPSELYAENMKNRRRGKYEILKECFKSKINEFGRKR
jgi:hypothetical protein